jgi:hypothetical protein
VLSKEKRIIFQVYNLLSLGLFFASLCELLSLVNVDFFQIPKSELKLLSGFGVRAAQRMSRLLTSRLASSCSDCCVCA